MLQDISTQAKYHRRAEESLTINVGRSATELKSTRPYILSIVKRLRACVKAGGGHCEHVLR